MFDSCSSLLLSPFVRDLSREIRDIFGTWNFNLESLVATIFQHDPCVIPWRTGEDIGSQDVRQKDEVQRGAEEREAGLQRVHCPSSGLRRMCCCRVSNIDVSIWEVGEQCQEKKVNRKENEKYWRYTFMQSCSHSYTFCCSLHQPFLLAVLPVNRLSSSSPAVNNHMSLTTSCLHFHWVPIISFLESWTTDVTTQDRYTDIPPHTRSSISNSNVHSCL